MSEEKKESPLAKALAKDGDNKVSKSDAVEGELITARAGEGFQLPSAPCTAILPTRSVPCPDGVLFIEEHELTPEEIEYAAKSWRKFVPGVVTSPRQIPPSPVKNGVKE